MPEFGPAQVPMSAQMPVSQGQPQQFQQAPVAQQPQQPVQPIQAQMQAPQPVQQPVQSGLVHLGGGLTYAPPGIQAPLEHYNYTHIPVPAGVDQPVAKTVPGQLPELPYTEHAPGMSSPMHGHQISSPMPLTLGQLHNHIQMVNRQGLFNRGMMPPQPPTMVKQPEPPTGNPQVK